MFPTRGFWERFAETVSGGGETHGFWEIVRASSALRDYGEASFGRQAQRVGEEIARTWDRPPDDPLCQGLARALCGVNVAVLTSGLERVTCGEDPATVVSDLLARADEAYDLLAHGLAEYTPLRA